MPELTINDINRISHDISREEITFSHLLDDLIDHVCCDVENEMLSGLSFNEAYRKVITKMGPRRIKEIQEETLYLVDTKYRNMKKMMKISGIAGTILLGFAALFKIQHWPAAGVMMTLGALLLAFVFLPSALGVLWKETHSRKRLFLFISAFFAGGFFIIGTLFKIQHWPMAAFILALAAFSGIFFFIPAVLSDLLRDETKKSKRPAYIFGAAGLIFYVAGMLFKIQHWPGASIMMLLGIALMGVVAFPLFVWLTWKNDKNIRAPFIYLVIGLFIIVVPGALINLNLQNSYDAGFYVQLENQKTFCEAGISRNKAILAQYHDSLSFPEMEKTNLKSAEVLSAIGLVESKMIAEAMGMQGMPATELFVIKNTEYGQEIQYSQLRNAFIPWPVKDHLLPGRDSRKALESALDNYSSYISGLSSIGDAGNYKNLLEASLYLPGESSDEVQISMLSGLHSLALLRNSILTVESSVLMAIAAK